MSSENEKKMKQCDYNSKIQYRLTMNQSLFYRYNKQKMHSTYIFCVFYSQIQLKYKQSSYCNPMAYL